MDPGDATTFSFTAELWRWSGDAAWHFVTLPEATADDIEELAAGRERGFGSVPVRVTIGATSWTTSLFPSKEAASYVLPVKAGVRRSEGLEAGDEAAITVEVAL